MGHLFASTPLPVVARLLAFVLDVLAAAANDAEVWACDGGDFIGTEVEVAAHLDAGFWAADGSLREWADVACHGSMLVGGPAWEAFTFEGVHPMATLLVGLEAELIARGLA